VKELDDLPFPSQPVAGGHRRPRRLIPGRQRTAVEAARPAPDPGGEAAPTAQPAPAAKTARPALLASEHLVPTLLPRQLGSRDLVAMLVAVTFFVWNAGGIQPAGPAGFCWWLIGFAAFFLPSAVVTRELARQLPGEGSIYLWAHHALGRFWGFVAGFCAWWPGVLAMVSLGPVLVRNLQYIDPNLFAGLGVESQGVLVAAVTVLGGVLACFPLRRVQHLVNACMLLYAGAVLLVVLAAVVWLASGHPARVDPFHPVTVLTTGLDTGHWTFFGLVVLALLGVEVPLNLGAELRPGVSPTRYLLWGGAAVMVGYLAVTWAVMVTVPPAMAADNPIVALPQAAAAAFGHPVGAVVAALFALAALTIIVVYHYTLSRLLFVSGLDRALPEAVTRLNARQVPVTAVRIQTVLVVSAVIVVFVLLPTLRNGGTAADIEAKAYNVAQAGLAVVWCLSMVLMFLAGLRLLSNAPIGRRLLVGGCAVLGIGSSVVAVIATFSGSWTALIDNQGWHRTILGAEVQWGSWSWLVLAVTLGSLAVGLGMYLLGESIGRRARLRMTTARPTGSVTPG
jgi:glutamate:GABA antiporter